jgi:hypothetical protein
MTTITAPAPQASVASNNGEKPINLFQLGCLFVIRASHQVSAAAATPRPTSTSHRNSNSPPANSEQRSVETPDPAWWSDHDITAA